MDSLECIIPQLISVLEILIQEHHDIYSLPLIAEYWEEILSKAFGIIGYETTWKPDRSHAVGEDMRLVGMENSRISCKSGQFIKPKALNKKCVKFNGSRSTKFKTLEEKITHFSNSHDDYYFLLSKNKPFDKKYKLIIFKSEICKVDKLTWTESDSGKQWKGIGDFMANIGKSMSAQLWTTLPLDMIKHIYDIDCN